MYCSWWRHQMETLPRYWPFVRGIHPVNSPHKGQWRGALMFSLICAWINNREAGDLRHHRAHYDVIVMCCWVMIVFTDIFQSCSAGIWLPQSYWNTPIWGTLQWRHNGHDSVSNHQPHKCLLNRLFRRRSKKISKFRVSGLCAGNSPETGECPAQMASNAESVSIWWRRHDLNSS